MSYILSLKTKKRKKKVEENSRNFQGLARSLKTFQGKMESTDFSTTLPKIQGLLRQCEPFHCRHHHYHYSYCPRKRHRHHRHD